MIVTDYEHNSGTCVFYLDYNEDERDFVLCAVDYNKDGQNVAQIDLDSYSPKQMKKLLKKMKRFVKEHQDG